MTATRTHPAPLSPTLLARRPLAAPPGRLHPIPASNGDRRDLLAKASRLHDEARRSAEEGDIAAAAQSILKALDCERRAGGLGPQVLQLIKPR